MVLQTAYKQAASKVRARFSKTVAVSLALALVLSMFGTIFLASGPAFAAEKKVTLIDIHDSWSYNDSNTNLFGNITSDFRSKDFDDSTWATGPAPLGYPATDKSPVFGAIGSGGTVVASSARPNAYLTYYFRKSFTVEDIASITKLEAQVAVDDGYVLYLNGNEISRVNMPEGAITWQTPAGDVWEPTEARANITLDLSAFRQYLVVGKNVLTAHVHNRDANSSDIFWGMTLAATYGTGDPAPEASKTPEQINVHVGDDATTQVNITYTTAAEQPTTATLTAEGATPLTFTGESSVGAANKYFHKIAISDLAPDTTYFYTVGDGINKVNGKFKTAPRRDSEKSVNFVYLADTQVSNATNARALGATLNEVAAMDPDFVYLAGDVTDTSTSEAQWEWLFKNDGAYPTGGAALFNNYLIAAVQGNHDNNTFNRHINAPAEMGNIVYSFEYGPITFVMLNLEAARSDTAARAQQEAYMRKEIAAAKAEGRWVAVGFHKSLYTGASHVTDSDVSAARAYWCPKFAEMDADFVLQGHDHVYSRGFVNAAGYNADVATGKKGETVEDPTNVPLYMIGGHAGALKWYSMKNYAVATGDPISPAYEFLDVNSANPASDPSGKGQGSDVRQEQVIVEFTASKNEVRIDTYMFKYDTASNTITTPKYLFDSITITRPAAAEQGIVAEAAVSGPATTVVENNEELVYTVSYDELVAANAFDTVVEYDANVFELVDTEGLANRVFGEIDTSTPGTVRAKQLLAVEDAITTSDPTAILNLKFRVKAGATANETSIKLVRADTVRKAESDASYVDIAAIVTSGTVVTGIISQRALSDINGDGVVTLADLSEASKSYRQTGNNLPGDVNKDGVVSGADFVAISSYIK